MFNVKINKIVQNTKYGQRRRSSVTPKSKTGGKIAKRKEIVLFILDILIMYQI